jgi:hypothetical protein
VIGIKWVNVSFFYRYSLLKLIFLTCYLDPNPHSFLKQDPDHHSLKKLTPHNVNVDPKHCRQVSSKKL